MTERPAIAVVIPTHDRDLYLEGALASVVGQRLPPDEVVVSDDLGSPTTRALVESFAAPETIRVRYVDSSSTGAGTAGASRNVGAAATTAPLIAFLDDDDTWHPDHLERLVEAVQGVDLAASSIVSDTPSFVIPQIGDGLGVADVVAHNPGFAGSNFLIRRETFVAVGGFDPRLRVANDLDLLVRLLSRGARYRTTGAITVTNRIHGAGRLTDKTERRAAGMRDYQRKHREAMTWRDRLVWGTLIAAIRRVSAPRRAQRLWFTAVTVAGRLAQVVVGWASR